MREPYRRTLLALVTATGLIAAACGSGADGAASDSPATASVPTIGSQVDDPTGAGTAPSSSPGPATSGPTVSVTPATAAPDPGAELAARALPATAGELAAELSLVEAELGRPDLDEASARPWGRRQQLLYRIMSANPDWVEPVLAQVDPAVAEIVALNWEARSSLSSLLRTGSISGTLPAWEITAPLPAEELIGYYKEAADWSGVPWTVLAAINLIESRMGRITGVSRSGAVGPMQFLPSTWAECCTGDPTVDRDAIMGAAQYLVDRGARRDLERGVFGYNPSENYVRAVLAHAEVLSLDEQRYYGYHAWEVVYLSSAGLVLLPEGYRQSEPVDAAAWLATNPGSLVAGGL